MAIVAIQPTTIPIHLFRQIIVIIIIIAIATTTQTQSYNMFEYNISFTIPVNPPGAQTLLTATELWTGISRVASTPQEYAPYVSKCEVLSQDGHALERKLTMSSGAVHKDDGEVMYQDVWTADDLLVLILFFSFPLSHYSHARTS
jgi:hypothetical protein